MKEGDLVRYKHFPDETGIVIKVHESPGREIDLLLPTGEIASALDSDAFEKVA